LRLPALLAVAVVLLLWAASGLGGWLVVTEPLRKADAIVVLGGHLPYRAMEAADIYNMGWAPEVWVTQTDNSRDRVTESLGIDYVREHEYSRRVLEKLGVPAGAIRMLEPKVVNTTDEVKAVAARLRSIGGTRVIFVSSKPHTRRIRQSWRALADRNLESVVRYADEDPYQANRWWGTSTDALVVMREVGGILNAWAGFPLEPSRN
jgi:uncharacterized SAM-binding protein YcdF (DUF218 family)